MYFYWCWSAIILAASLIMLCQSMAAVAAKVIHAGDNNEPVYAINVP
jgi:hypothetical protein